MSGDFSDAVELFTHEGITDGNWCEVTKGHEERVFTYENNCQIWW